MMIMILAVIGIGALLLLIPVYCSFIISGRCARDEERYAHPQEPLEHRD